MSGEEEKKPGPAQKKAIGVKKNRNDNVSKL